MAGSALAPRAETEMLDRLEDLLRRARSRGAVEADAFMVEEELQTVQVRLGTVESLKHARENRCSLRIFTESGSASATTSDLSPGALARLVDESVRLAQVTRRDEHSGLPAPEALARDVPDLGLWDADGHAMSVEEKIDWARRAEAAALESDARVRNSEGAEFYDRQGRVAYASSGGFAGGFRVSSFALSVTPVASDEGDMERDFWYTSARRLADLRSPEEVGREAARRAVRRLGGRKGETTEVPVVFDPETAASLMRSLAVAASGPSLYRGTSFLIGQHGKAVASPHVTIVDDPLMPQGLGSRPFDGEGLPSRRTVLVDHGVLSELPPRHVQRPSARADRDGQRGPGGRGRRDGGVHEPLPRARAVGPRGDRALRRARALRHGADRLRGELRDGGLLPGRRGVLDRER